MEAKIELVAKPISLFEFAKEQAPQHLYILITMSDGEKIGIRGGPEGGDKINNWLIDDLKVVNLPYDKYHPDFDLENKHTKTLLAQGNDDYIKSIVNHENVKKAFEMINNGGLDYKAAIPGISYGSWQNSNTAARIVTEAMGFKFELPKFQDAKGIYRNIWAPGFDEMLGDTWYDQKSKTLTKVGKKAYQELDQQIKVTSENYVHSMESDGPTSRFGADLRMMYKINQLNKNLQCDIADNNKNNEEYGPPYVKAGNSNPNSEHNKKDDDTYGPPYFGDPSGPINPSGPSGDGGPKNPNNPNIPGEGPSGGDFGGGSSPNVGNGGGSGGGGGSSSKWYESSFWEGAWTKGWSGESKLQHEFHGQSQQQSRHQSSSKSESKTDFRLAA